MDVFIQKRRGPAPNNSDVEVLDQVFFRHVSPMLEKLDGLCERQGSELFRSYMTAKDARLSGSGGISDSLLGALSGSGGIFDSLLGTDQWERTKKQYLVRPGFELSDGQQVKIGAEYSFYGYIGTGNRGFDLKLSVVWKLRGERFSFEAEIDGIPLTAIGHHVSYSELDGRDAEVDHTVEAICRCMMDEIDSRSQGRNRSDDI